MKTFIISTLFLAIFLFTGTMHTLGQPVGKIYSNSELMQWQSRYKTSNNRLLKERIFPVLSSYEEAKLRGVYLNTPLIGKAAEEPLVFYRYGKEITLSTHSIKFFDDLFIAYAWLSQNGRDVSAITDYVAKSRYKKSSGYFGGKYLKPFEALSIPRHALNNKEVDNLSIHYLNSFRTFLIAHELGHIYHNHRSASGTRSREQEREADRFAMTIMRRLEYFPIGTILFFSTCSHLSWDVRNSTHPLDAERLQAIAKGLEDGKRDFAQDRRLGGGYQAQNRVQFFANEIRKLASILREKDLQHSLQLSNQHNTAPHGTSGQLYSGTYTRTISSYESEQFPVKVSLQWRGNQVSGMFDFGLGKGQIYQGRREDGVITFYWKWYNKTGKGKFFIYEGGKRLKGTWGKTRGGVERSSGGGKWDIRKQ